MSGEPRIIAIDSDEAEVSPPHASPPHAPAVPLFDEASSADGEIWDDQPPPRRHGIAGTMLGALALVALAGWTGLFVFANLGELHGGGLADWAHATTAWSAPAILIAVAWLLARQLGRGQAHRFLDTAQALDQATARLETRLTTANRELSLAREFLAAQSRDLDAVGRVAVERISQHAEQLRGLIESNGARIDAIGTVSATARENMELLRDHLPVVANSAKDVANNIGNGGRIAQAQLQELVNGLIRLNEFGVACERQVAQVSGGVETALTSLSAQLGDIEASMAARTQAMAYSASALSAEISEREAAAIDAFEAQNTRLRATIAETGERLNTYTTASAAAHAEQARHLADFTAANAAATTDLETIGTRLKAIIADAGASEASLRGQAEHIAATIAASQHGAAEAAERLATLTDASVRLLELIQASVDHSQNHLPAAINAGAQALEAVEGRAAQLHATVSEAAARGQDLATHVATTHETARDTLASIDNLHGQLADHTAHQQSLVAGLRESVAATNAEANALAERVQGELTDAIAQLTAAARDAVSAIEQDSAARISQVAEKLGVESGAAVDRAMRAHTQEVAGQLEAASTHAASVSREAAIQLRNQLGKVDELVGNLEQRVAQARARAEEQVDNDFGRRMAAITEALNSSAVDIARAVDSEVEDTAWAGYLRGDRGIFTRRAVRLLSAAEGKEIAQIYQTDAGFANNVNRYIHDFEGILRQLLATRDGHTMSVIMLSSDAGKLYVALAQAIDRLRD